MELFAETVRGGTAEGADLILVETMSDAYELKTAVLAAKVCLEGYSLSEDMLFFLNPRIAQSFWIVRCCAPVMSIGNHDFYG